MNRLGHVLHRLRHADPVYCTVASIVSAFAWAIMLAWEGDTMARQTYFHMARIAPEWVWTITFTLIGLVQMTRLAFDHNGNAWQDYILKALACILWSYVAAACILAQNPPPAAMGDAVAVAVLTWIDFARAEPGGHRCDR
jgi:hypothetical protein